MSIAIHKDQARIRVLVVDDSLSLCTFLEKILSRDPDIEVVGYALDAYEAREKIKRYQPDVLTLDVEMPHMDGLTFLRNLMRLRPMPVVMISSLTAAGAEVTLDALNAGAVDFMVKRHPFSQKDLDVYCSEIISRVKQAGMIHVTDSNRDVSHRKPLPDLTLQRQKLIGGTKATKNIRRLIVVGASTGGPEALRRVLEDLDSSDCTLLIAQHMPDRFMASFAARLDSWSQFKIGIPINGETLLPGKGYVAPGDHHLEVVRQAGELRCRVTHAPSINGHRPSVDVLFNSVARSVASCSVGLLLTGMGEDGAVGLTRMRAAGSLTIVQDETSSAVWGMPGRAHDLGGADCVLPLQQIPHTLNSLLSNIA